jgi:hypothetical protein
MMLLEVTMKEFLDHLHLTLESFQFVTRFHDVLATAASKEWSAHCARLFSSL